MNGFSSFFQVSGRLAIQSLLALLFWLMYLQFTAKKGIAEIILGFK